MQADAFAFSVAEQATQTESFNLDKAIDRIAHWLPTQGPIKDFIHHNTLHAVQDRPFHEGVAIAAGIFGAKSYLPLADYQQRYANGRITDQALDWAIEQAGIAAVERLRFRQALFATDHKSHYAPASLANEGIRSTWLNEMGLDLNALVHPVIFRLLANFLDQGISRWTLACSDESFWACLNRLIHNSLWPLYPFQDAAVKALMLDTPDQVIVACLEKIVGNSALYEQYILEMLLGHPGWSGMVRLIEENPQLLLAQRRISLKEVIGLELACELAFLYLKQNRHFKTIADLLRTHPLLLLQDKIRNPKPPLLLRVWQEAMEWSLHAELLKALNTQPGLLPPQRQHESRPQAQALFCLDDRECSLRRNLEELNPSIETFGAAGFFGIDFFYQGLQDAYPVAQCPVIITPKHLVRETSLDEPVLSLKKTAVDRQAGLHVRPYSLFRGWLFTQTLGMGYAFKLALSVFVPGKSLPGITQLSEVKAHTRLHLVRESEALTEDSRLLGFSYPEMADRLEGLLRNIGLIENFAPLVVVVAHGSSSVNNPHFAAYDCGACAGKPGAPNARAFAWMANQKQVRALLAERGILIPDDTHFVPALHNTSRDEIDYFDSHLYGDGAIPGLDEFQQAMARALELNALERCRWFELAPQDEKAKGAHEHVKERSVSIFEPRPEYNHSNNLYAIVGRRQLSRGLYMDRRAFLHSYDPDSDLQGIILARILNAVIPVCGGINLEYLFSRMDNSVYGAGTKLPHNVIGLLGVANGVEGDLRTGLPSQMIEVHEPARLLIVVEQKTAIADKAFVRLGSLMEWLDNEWIRLACCHPVTRAITLYSKAGWRPVDFSEQAPTPEATDSQVIYARQTSTIPIHKLARSH